MQSSILGNERCLLLAASNLVTFFGTTIALHNEAVIDWLIKWVQLASAVDRSPVLDHSGLRAWTQLTYFLSFYTSSVFPFHFAVNRIFISSSVQTQTPRGGSIISEWPSYNKYSDKKESRINWIVLHMRKLQLPELIPIRMRQLVLKLVVNERPFTAFNSSSDIVAMMTTCCVPLGTGRPLTIFNPKPRYFS